ncbi:MAG: IPT/TIG domain-containing protein [Blastocatellia bacterium]
MSLQNRSLKPNSIGQRFVLLTALLSLFTLLWWSHQVATVAASQDTRPAASPGTSMSGTRGIASRTAVVNVAQLARQEQLAPPTKQPLAIENEFDDEGAAPHNKPVPAGAFTPSDRLVSSELTAPPSAPSPAPASSFQALNDDNSRIPPDTHGAVGPNHLMVTLNSQVRIQTKAGATISTVSLNGFWATFGHTNVFDPRVLYDPTAGRWIFISLSDWRTATSSLLVGVSQTGDPTGNWNLYDTDIDSANAIFADYPNVGLNKDWIVVATDTYRVSDVSFVAERLYTFGKANLYAGGASSFTLFQDTTGSSQVPAVINDNTTSTMYILENWNGNQSGSGYLRMSTISGAVGAESYTPGVAFPSTPNPWDSLPPSPNWMPQLGSSQRIIAGDAVVQNLVYRNGSLWCAQTVFLPAGGSPTRSAIQWWQLSTSGAIQQRGRLDDPSGNVYYGYPSIAVNSHNDVVIGYSRFSSSFYAGSGYSIRAATDPVNTLRDVAVLKNGEAPYYKTNGGTKNKWGDYSATVVDPANDIDIWTIQEYAAQPVSSVDRWGTWWGRFDLSSIPPLPTPATDVVLYASEAPTRVGNWQAVADSTAAGGARIWNPDAGVAKITTPLANPPSYFEMTFNAQAGTAYHLWMRGRAQNDSPYNDSVHIQFSDSLDANGAAVYRIGTTTSTEYNLEDCSGCGLSGWGWQDNGWGVGVMGPNLYFAASGTHTIRVQPREDGLSIDQIVLSPSTYLNTSPGALKNDATILPKSGGAGGNPAPGVSGVSPNSGPTAGGSSVTITGANFVSGATVSFGGTAATNVVISNATTITAATPAHAAGAVDVTVTNPDGQSGTLTGGFTYTAPGAQTPRFGHVFLVVEENHSYANVIGSSAMPYLNSLAARYGLATNYYANAHPSIGNYFMLTTGQIVTNDDSFGGTVSVDNLVRQMIAAGRTWKSYAESLPSVGWTGGDSYPYAKRHNPFAYLTDVLNSTAQTNNMVPLSQFAGDLTNNRLPNFSYILPNQLNNGHDCPNGSTCTDADKLAATDNWLNANIAPLLSSAVFQQDGLLIILWDESVDTDTANGGGHIAALVISPRAKPGYRSTTFYQHQNALRAVAEAMGLTTFPGASASAQSMAEFFDASTSPTPNVTGITPNTGLPAGGTSVTISGSGFTPGATVMIGGVPATNVSVTSNTTITATTPAHAAGTVSVTVTNTNGLSGTLTNGFTYSTPSGETVLLADDFNNNSLDLTKWNTTLFSGFTDSSVPMAEANQRLEIGPLFRLTGSSHYAGLSSRQRYDFTGAYAWVAVVQAPAITTTGDAMFTLGPDANNYYRIYEEAGVLYIQKRLGGGAKVTMWSGAYDATQHRYWRIKHEAASNSVVFETAADNGGTPGAWVERWREAWSTAFIPLGNVLLEIKGGTWQSESGTPGKVIFDDFKAATP